MSDAQLNVSLVYSPRPREVFECSLQVPAGTSVAQALQASGIFEEFPELQKPSPDRVTLGVWGKRVTRSRLLRNDDRIEIYRNLRVDPKIARRERFSRQGIKRAGLFSAVRSGAKAGY